MITTAVGSFPKVAESGYGTAVMGAINRWQKKDLSDEGLERVFQEVTREVIKEQEEIGLDLLTDGQIRWEDLVTPFAKSIDGFEINGLERFFDNNVYYRKPILHKAPTRSRPIFVEDYLFARRCTTKPLKAVLPGPYTIVELSDDRYYRNARLFMRRIAELLNEEAKALIQAGAPIIQFDEPALGFGKPPITQVMESMDLATDGLKAPVAVSIYFGRVTQEILEALQRRRGVAIIGVDVVSDPKALDLMRRLKWTKGLALGCLDARNTKLESVEELHAVFDTVKKLLPLEQVSVSPNCGLEFLPHEHARQKLARLVEAVRTYPANTHVRTPSDREATALQGVPAPISEIRRSGPAPARAIGGPAPTIDKRLSGPGSKAARARRKTIRAPKRRTPARR